MQTKIFINEFFNICDTLNCGQIFRYTLKDGGYLVYSLDKVAFCKQLPNGVEISTLDSDMSYFEKFFDLSTNYKDIYNSALSEGGILSVAAKKGKGIRILNQNCVETLFSFIISQNNNIPRIKKILNALCKNLGQKKQFLGSEYYAFPTVDALASKGVDFYKSLGLGYRAPYIKSLADSIINGLDIKIFNSLSTPLLKKQLTCIYGVGPKVADCVALFGYHRSDSFPVDTWLEKVYRQDFGGKEVSRNKITDFFQSRFKQNSGYFQQYLFYYFRENKINV